MFLSDPYIKSLRKKLTTATQTISSQNEVLKTETAVDRLIFEYLTDKDMSSVLSELELDQSYIEPQWRYLDEPAKIGGSGYVAWIVYDMLTSSAIRGPAASEIYKAETKSADVIKNLMKDGMVLHDQSKVNSYVKDYILNISAMLCLVDTTDATDKQMITLQRSIQAEGYFPYVKPNRLVRLLDEILPSKYVQKIIGDRSTRFYDVSHHCYILLCILLRLQKNPKDEHAINIIHSALPFVVNLVLNENLFRGEPEATYPRFCNFGDVTAYFILLRCFYLCHELDLPVDDLAKEKLAAKVLNVLDEWEFCYTPIDNNSNSKGFVLPAIWMDKKYKLYHLKIMLEASSHQNILQVKS